MNAIVSALHLMISLFALWFLYFFCWREHRIDTYRQRLFAIRDELFDYAASGAIKFDDPAYTTLRDLSNGLIRFAHRMTFTRVLANWFFGKVPRTNHMETWMVDVNNRPAGVRDKLLKAHTQIANASVFYVVAWSPFAWIYVLCGVVSRLLRVGLSIKIGHTPRELSSVLEQEALEQSSLNEDDERCLAAV
jgi:hypothetical protein